MRGRYLPGSGRRGTIDAYRWLAWVCQVCCFLFKSILTLAYFVVAFTGCFGYYTPSFSQVSKTRSFYLGAPALKRM